MLEKPGAPCLSASIGVWMRQFVVTDRNLLLNPPRRRPKAFGRSSPRCAGDDNVLRIENYLGRLDGLLRERRTCAQNLAFVAGAPWRDAGPAARA